MKLSCVSPAKLVVILCCVLSVLAHAVNILGACTGANFSVEPGSPVGAGAGPISVAVGDFNGDGKPDLAVADVNIPNSFADVTILLGNGNGGFTQAPGSPVGHGNGQTRSVTTGDFNGDGKLDLAVTDEGPSVEGTVQILLGNGSGGFSEAAGSPIRLGFPVFTAVGDFNGDGKLDLAVARGAAAPSGGQITILLGNGSGGFAEAAGSPVGVGGRPVSVAVSDFNGDGKPDLAVVNSFSFNVTILLGNGNGGFTEAAGSPIPSGSFGIPVSVAAGDFNGDGKPDLAVAESNASIHGAVNILLGNGSGGFSPAAGSPVGAGDFPFSVAVGDFNGDGKPDLAVANNVPSDNVTILLGNGSGGFDQPAGSPVGAGNQPVSVAVGDFNGDGNPDLAVANYNSNNVTILLNTCNANHPPVAKCKNVTASAGPGCTSASASVDDGSSDPDAGDSITLSQSPPGPYPLGTTPVTLTVTDSHGESSTCNATVTVNCTEPFSRDINSYVLFATDEMVIKGGGNTSIGPRGRIVGGNVGVNGVGLFKGNPRLRFGGDKVFMSDGKQAVADTARLTSDHSVDQLFVNTLSGNPPIVPRTSGPTPFALIDAAHNAAIIATANLPTCPPFAPGASSITVPTGNTRNLFPGSYGDVRVNDGGVLNLSAGMYNLKSLSLGKNVRVITTDTTEVRVAQNVSMNTNPSIGPACGAKFFVCSDGISNGFSVGFSQNGKISGQWIVPNGEVNLGDATDISGRISAKSISGGSNVNITFCQ